MFNSFFQGGFESSTHCRQDGTRLDVIRATAHDIKAEEDYAMLAGIGIRTVRDGIRWHLIETEPFKYQWDSLIPMLEAAYRQGTQVIWDLLHFGWPDGLDIFSDQFLVQFSAFAKQATLIIKEHSSGIPWICPVNEGSFLSWAGGDHALMNPMCIGRGDELKRRLAVASMVATDAIRSVDPAIRIVHCDPVINVQPDPLRPETITLAHQRTEAQFHFLDMISGFKDPQLGGRPDYLDVIGINYYCHNQWIVDGPPLDWPGNGECSSLQHSLAYIPPSQLFARVHARYERPLFIAETGIESSLRPAWLRYICNEVENTLAGGIPVYGICLYPILNHPGWDDNRHCPNGLIDYIPFNLKRSFEIPLLETLYKQQNRFKPYDAKHSSNAFSNQVCNYGGTIVA